jgi:hypothetical protein
LKLQLGGYIVAPPLQIPEQVRTYFVAGLTKVTLSFCSAATRRGKEKETFYFTVVDAGSEIFQSSHVSVSPSEPIVWRIEEPLKKRFFNDAQHSSLNLMICVYKFKKGGLVLGGPMPVFAHMRYSNAVETCWCLRHYLSKCYNGSRTGALLSIITHLIMMIVCDLCTGLLLFSVSCSLSVLLPHRCLNGAFYPSPNFRKTQGAKNTCWGSARFHCTLCASRATGVCSKR